MNEKRSGKYILAIDAGTSGTTVMLFDSKARKVNSVSAETEQIYPQPGYVEHDPEKIRQSVFLLMQRACGSITPPEIAAVGIANQRETTILWDRTTGRPVHNAIVWQCRRTESLCSELEKAGLARRVHNKTGLRLDAYFSASKIRWMLDNIPDLRRRADDGEIAFGTVDSWLLWNLTGGKVHATDATNASRTLLYNIETRTWDDGLLEIFDIPKTILPEVKMPSEFYGNCRASVLGEEVPIYGVAGDQQAALFGQGCVNAGDSKNTYGTGCFLLINTGSQRYDSKAGLLTTLACGPRGEITYALEGAIFSAGSSVQWLRDGLGLIRKAAETEEMASSVPDAGGVYLIPAFTGLGAPYWNMNARAAILGLTRGSSRAHIARAALESIAYQVCDLVEAATQDIGEPLKALKADGGASANDFLMRFQADLLGVPVEVPENVETTALGAAFLAGLACGFWSGPEELDTLRRKRRSFEPKLKLEQRLDLLAKWHHAVETVLKGTAESGPATETGI